MVVKMEVLHKILFSYSAMGISIFEFLDLDDISMLDRSMTNHNIRFVWLKCPKKLTNYRISPKSKEIEACF